MPNKIPLNVAMLPIANNIRDKALIAYDADGDFLYDSGLFSPYDGELNAAAGSVNIGLQKISSAGEQVTVTNINSGVTYAPPWHIVNESSPGGSYDRFYGNVSTSVRFPVRKAVVEDPVMNVTIPTDTLALSFNFTWPEAQNGVVFSWTQNGLEIWRDVRNVSAGTHDEVFETPLAYRAGNYVFRMYRLDGEPLKVMGDPQTGYAGYSVRYRPWYEKMLATQEYVQQLIMENPSSGGDMMKKDYDPDGDGIVEYSALAFSVDGMEQAKPESFYGKTSSGASGFVRMEDTGAYAAMLELLAEQEANLKKARDVITKLVSRKIDRIEVKDRDDAMHTMTLSLIANDKPVADTVLDFGAWFNNTPDPTKGGVRYGFTEVLPGQEIEFPDESVVTHGRFEHDVTLDGFIFNVSRLAGSRSQKIWFWTPITMDQVCSFRINQDSARAWPSQPMVVDGVKGIIYMSRKEIAETNANVRVNATPYGGTHIWACNMWDDPTVIGATELLERGQMCQADKLEGTVVEFPNWLEGNNYYFYWVPVTFGKPNWQVNVDGKLNPAWETVARFAIQGHDGLLFRSPNITTMKRQYETLYEFKPT